MAAAYICCSLNAIKSRVVHSKENFTFTVCNMEGGSTFNVMPFTCSLKATLRTYNEETKKLVCEKIRKIATSVAQAHDCTAEVDIFDLYPAVVNHPAPTETVKRVAENGFGSPSEEDLPLTAGEDFSYFLL